MRLFILLGLLLAISIPVRAAKPCEELKGEIAAKLDAKQVKGYSLEIVENEQVGKRKVVGSCEGGTKKIVYTRASQPADVPTAKNDKQSQ